MPSYRVVIIDRSGTVLKECPVVASSVTEAAFAATGENLVRGERGHHYWLRAKVYSDAGALPTMTRLYSKSPFSDGQGRDR